jgi:hypothetical protein
MSPSPFAETLNAAMRHALEHLGGLRERGVDATASLEDLRGRIDVPLTDAGVAPEQVIEELVKACDGGIVGGRATGEAFFTPTTWHGVRAMRISVSNWQTTMEDVDPVVACAANVLTAERAKLLAGGLQDWK